MLCYLSRGERKAWKIQSSNPDLCNAGVALYQLSDQANWELVIMWVYHEPIESGYVRFNWWNFAWTSDGNNLW